MLQARELECRRAEANGGEPPEVPEDVTRILPERTKLQIAAAFVRRDNLRIAKANAEEQ
jgi:hypothetical protein